MAKDRREYFKQYRRDNPQQDAKRRTTPEHKFYMYKYKAAERNIEFNLTSEEFNSFWQQPCNYCNREIDTIGIDRVNNTVGYVMDNCVSCCSVCNKMKLDTPLDVWQANMAMVLKHMGLI
jgi:uncharacterized protein with PIN domain